MRWVLGPRALHTLLDNWTSLPQEIETLRNTAGALSGRLSVDILRNLEEFSIDVGLTYFLEVMRPISDDRAVPLIDPTVEHSVGLVAVDRDPVSPLVIAAFECARVTEPPAVSTRS